MKREDMFLLLLLLFLSVPWTAGQEGVQEDRGMRCSEQVMKERETRREANITITVRDKKSVKMTFFLSFSAVKRSP